MALRVYFSYRHEPVLFKEVILIYAFIVYLFKRNFSVQYFGSSQNEHGKNIKAIVYHVSYKWGISSMKTVYLSCFGSPTPVLIQHLHF